MAGLCRGPFSAQAILSPPPHPFGITAVAASDPLHHAFEMVADARTKVLILGSLPGQKSLAARRYYANPANQFWRLLGPVIGVDLVGLNYEERLVTLLARGIGLWDVIGSARRFGSLDSALRDADERDLTAVIGMLPALRAMAFNGAAAYKIGVRQLGEHPPIEMVALPSSSGAHAVGIAAKQPEWNRLYDFIG
jgi:double-stranded uracil-DNA glycosylase